MRTYCKRVDIENPAIVSGWIFDYLHGEKNRPPKWRRKDYQLFMVEWSCYSLDEIKLAVEYHNHNILLEICDDISREVCARIRRRDLRLAPIKFFKRIDGISLKERDISHESIMQQIMDAVAVYALMPLFKAKILPHQYASIKNRGQVAGANKIAKWIRRDKRCRYYGKADVKKCFQSLSRRVIMRLLRRDIRKNATLLWLVDSLLSTYWRIENGKVVILGLVIGTLLSQWLCNYALSYLFRYVQGLRRTQRRRGEIREVKLVYHILFYMDDIFVTGLRAADVQSALRKAATWAKKMLGISLHDEFKILGFATNAVDMMGYVIGYESTTIRARIFLRARRHYLRAAVWLRHNKRLTLRRAQNVISYYGYFKNSDSTHIKAKLNVETIFAVAKRNVSFYTLVNHQKGPIAA